MYLYIICNVAYIHRHIYIIIYISMYICNISNICDIHICIYVTSSNNIYIHIYMLLLDVRFERDTLTMLCCITIVHILHLATVIIFACLLLFYDLTTSMFISKWPPTCGSDYFTVLPYLETMLSAPWPDISLSHIIMTENQPVLIMCYPALAIC